MFYDDVKGNNFGIIIKGAEREREIKWNLI